MSKSLAEEARKQDYNFCNKIPETGSSYNSSLEQPGFFTDDTKFDSFKSRFFLRWYSQLLIKHGQDVLSAARKAFNRRTTVNVKLSGTHWWYNHQSKSHAAELTSGIFTSMHHDGYGPVLKMLQSNGVGLNLAVDKSYPLNESQPSHNASDLMNEVMDVAFELDLVVTSWNVVPCMNEESYLKVLDEALNDKLRDKYSIFNYHGLKPLLENPKIFEDFVKKMHGKLIKRIVV
ncbi:beta-amylase 2, chloroplastic-like [Bidens hawaiensis]|uniref:beta-amylase 2, chloroplastic-like n=1 Tax=Bidens hawaiensis TaxID=980011 RepID=UPI00404B325D